MTFPCHWRFTLTWFFPFCLALLVGGCTRPPGAQTELLYSTWGSVEQQKVEKAIAAEFERSNPDIRIRLLPIGQRYSEKIQAMMVGKVAPDLMMVDITQYDEWASRGTLKDVTDIVGKLTEEDEFLPVPRRCFERNGRFYAVPVNVHGFAMYCNLGALREVGIPVPTGGWTWDQLLPSLARLTKKTNPRSPTDYAMLMPPIDALLAAFESHLLDNPENPTRVTADQPETIAAFDFYKSLYKSGYVVPADVASDQGTFQLFRDGRVAFFFSGRWSTPELAGKTKFAWDVLPFPAGPAGSVTMHGGTGLAISGRTRHPREAERFLEFYASPQGAALAMQGFRSVPVYKALSQSEEFLNLTPPASLTRFTDTMKSGASRIQLYAPGYAELNQLSMRCLHRIVYRDVPVTRSVQVLQQDLERWLQKRSAK